MNSPEYPGDIFSAKLMENAVPEEQAKKQQRDKRMPPGASSHEQPPATVSDVFPAVGEDPEADYYEPDRLLVTEEDYTPDADTEPPSAEKIRTSAECSPPPQNRLSQFVEE